MVCHISMVSNGLIARVAACLLVYRYPPDMITRVEQSYKTVETRSNHVRHSPVTQARRLHSKSQQVTL